MQIKDLEQKSKEIWGEENLPLAQMLVRLGKIYGDMCRWERDDKKNTKTHTDEELKKELGNLIFSSIKFASDLGYEPQECIRIAIDAQEKYAKDNR